jgi:putative transposase
MDSTFSSQQTGRNSPPRGAFTADDVYTAIVDGEIAFDLEGDLISETDRSLVYRDQDALAFAARIESAPDVDVTSRSASLDVGTRIIYDGQQYTIQLLGGHQTIIAGEDGPREMPIATILQLYHEGKLDIEGYSAVNLDDVVDRARVHALTPEEMSKANERAQILRDAALSPEAAPVSQRTLQRWRKRVRDAVSSVAKNLSLVAQTRLRGNRNRKIPQEVIDLIAPVVKIFNSPRAPNATTAYRDFVDQCHKHGLRPCSYPAFCAELRRGASVLARAGKRLAYQLEAIVWYLVATEPVHGVRPFQYVHIDHTQLDIILIHPTTKERLGKPWLSLAIDAESRAIVGFYLSFESPSYRSCMMILRDIVRRHGRLPDTFILDNGNEFTSSAYVSSSAST